jgi:putative spermidine/putrescine transport system permease protein
MSSSSTPEPASATPRLDVAELQQAEEVLEQHHRRAERALAEREQTRSRRAGLLTAAWAAPGTMWLGFYLLAPVVMILLVSFWTGTESGFSHRWTTENYSALFNDGTYWKTLYESFYWALIVVAACLVFGFPIAYFLALKVQNLRNQIALFIVALAPFWTSYLIRAIAWNYPLMGREGGINTILRKIGIINQPLDVLAFSRLAVTLAEIQLFILFMVTPLFFMLAQIDRSSLEAARDLGGNWFRTFREVIIPLSMPGIVIGSIFIFVLTMGDYGTTRIVGGGQVSSVGTIIQNQVNSVQYPGAAASALFLVLVMMIGVFVLLRFSNLREEI